MRENRSNPDPGSSGMEVSMATIARGRGIVTLINVFTVERDKQQKLVDVLIDATEHTMKSLPGFISASIHKSFDRTKVVNYAQWQRREDFDAMTRSPDARPHIQAAAALAQFDPILCDVVDSIGLDG